MVLSIIFEDPSGNFSVGLTLEESHDAGTAVTRHGRVCQEQGYGAIKDNSPV